MGEPERNGDHPFPPLRLALQAVSSWILKLQFMNFPVEGALQRLLGNEIWKAALGEGNEWQLTPVFLPGEFHGQRSLVGYSPWGHKESDTTK